MIICLRHENKQNDNKAPGIAFKMIPLFFKSQSPLGLFFLAFFSTILHKETTHYHTHSREQLRQTVDKNDDNSSEVKACMVVLKDSLKGLALILL